MGKLIDTDDVYFTLDELELLDGDTLEMLRKAINRAPNRTNTHTKVQYRFEELSISELVARLDMLYEENNNLARTLAEIKQRTMKEGTEC